MLCPNKRTGRRLRSGMRRAAALLTVIALLFGAAHATGYGTYGTQVDAFELAGYLQGIVGEPFPSGYCLRFVRETFQMFGAPRNSACCAYRYGMMHIMSNEMGDIPIGADVFFSGGARCSVCGCSTGHIGIYVGDGRFVHATAGSVHISSLYEERYMERFLGWGVHEGVILVGGDVTVAALERDPLIPIAREPDDTYAMPGGGAVYLAEAEATDVTYRWQSYDDESEEWAYIPDAESQKLKLSGVTEEMSGTIYRCVLTDPAGQTETTVSASLTVLERVEGADSGRGDGTVCGKLLYDSVDVLCGPGLQYPRAGKLSREDALVIVGKTENWYAVMFGEAMGFIYASYAVPIPSGFHVGGEPGIGLSFRPEVIRTGAAKRCLT